MFFWAKMLNWIQAITKLKKKTIWNEIKKCKENKKKKNQKGKQKQEYRIFLSRKIGESTNMYKNGVIHKYLCINDSGNNDFEIILLITWRD